jgi:hypothetical protein
MKIYHDLDYVKAHSVKEQYEMYLLHLNDKGFQYKNGKNAKGEDIYIASVPYLINIDKTQS